MAIWIGVSIGVVRSTIWSSVPTCQQPLHYATQHIVTEPQDIQLATRVGKSLHDKILKRQQEAKKMTGIEPSISEVVRALLEEATSGKRRSGG